VKTLHSNTKSRQSNLTIAYLIIARKLATNKLPATLDIRWNIPE